MRRRKRIFLPWNPRPSPASPGRADNPGCRAWSERRRGRRRPYSGQWRRASPTDRGATRAPCRAGWDAHHRNRRRRQDHEDHIATINSTTVNPCIDLGRREASSSLTADCEAMDKRYFTAYLSSAQFRGECCVSLCALRLNGVALRLDAAPLVNRHDRLRAAGRDILHAGVLELARLMLSVACPASSPGRLA